MCCLFKKLLPCLLKQHWFVEVSASAVREEDKKKAIPVQVKGLVGRKGT